MKRRWVLLLLAVLAGGLGVGLLIPDSRIVLFGLIRGESFTAWKPTSYWIEELHQRDTARRKEAIEALSEIGPGAEAAVPDLLEIVVTENNKDVYWMAAGCLGGILSHLGPAGQKYVPTVAGLLKHPLMNLRGEHEIWKRFLAAEMLGSLGENARSAIPELTKALRDPHGLVRTEAAKALRAIDQQVAITALIDALRDKSRDVWEDAANALGQIGPPAERAVPALRKASEDKEWSERRVADDALKKIERK